MKKYRQWIAICAGLLLVSISFTALIPKAFTHMLYGYFDGALVLGSVGKYERVCYFRSDMFANGSTYEKYVYSKANFENNRYFKRVTESDAERIRVYTEHFYKCVDALRGIDDPQSIDLVANYDFDPVCITEDDYVYFDDLSPQFKNEFDLFRFWFYYYDTESNTMYQFRNRISYGPVEDTIGIYECIYSDPHYTFKYNTLYAEYRYSVVRFQDNPYFKKVTKDDEKAISGAFFSAQLSKNTKDDGGGIRAQHGFDPDCITEDDYFYITGGSVEDRKVYLFDTESNILYRYDLDYHGDSSL